MPRRKRDNGYVLPDNLTDHDLLCLTMQVPDDPTYRAAIVGAITSLTKWWNWETTGDNSGSIAAQYWLRLIVDTLEIDECSTPAADGDESQGSGGFDEFLERLIEEMPKFRLDGQLYEPVIDLVPCGCNGGDGEGDREGDVLPPGGTPGGDYAGAPTLCDFITTVVPQILDRVDDFLGTIQNGTYVVDQFDGITETLVGSLVENVNESIGEIEGELTDPDFIEEARLISGRHFNDPIGRIDRASINAWARRFPLVFEGAPMWGAFVLWAAQVNLNEINQLVSDSAGTGDATICNPIFSQVGRPPYNPDEQPGVPDFSVTVNGLTFTRIAQNVNAPEFVQPDITASNVDGFLGICVMANRLAGGGAGSASRLYRLECVQGLNADARDFDQTGRESSNGDWIRDFYGVANIVNVFNNNYPDYRTAYDTARGGASESVKAFQPASGVTLPGAIDTVGIGFKSDELAYNFVEIWIVQNA